MLFNDAKLVQEIYGVNEVEVTKYNSLTEWLKKPPSYTSFRINKLKCGFSVENVQRILKEQAKSLDTTEIPQCSYLKEDCLLVSRWPTMPKFPKVTGEVIVDCACGAAVLRGSHVFAPGVMGMPSDIQVDEVVNIFADVDGKCKKGLKIKFEGRKLFVGIGLVKIVRSELFVENAIPNGVAVQTLMPESRLPVLNSSIAQPGQVLLQNVPSIVCGWVVDPQPGEHILDMCAAPGNKTTHLAELSNDKARIIALDKSISKVTKIKENCRLHGVSSVQCYVQDSTKCLSNEQSGDGLHFHRDMFDKILLDAPCSAMGQRPQFINKLTVKMLQSYKFLQRKLFATAVDLLKPGGVLVYSTCTISRDENEGLVAWAVGKYPLRLVAAEPLVGGPGWAGCGLSDEQRLLVQRFGNEDDPLRRVDDVYKDTVGFFIAKFKELQ